MAVTQPWGQRIWLKWLLPRFTICLPDLTRIGRAPPRATSLELQRRLAPCVR